MFICIICGTEYKKHHIVCECGARHRIINIPKEKCQEFNKSLTVKSAACLIQEKTDYQKFPDFEFLGDLSPSYNIMVFGEPGSGKSTFCLFFANAHAKLRKRFMYVSGEERWSATFRKKLDNFGVDSPYLLVSESITTDKIIKDIKLSNPKGIVIDSVTTLNLNVKDLRKIRKMINGPMLVILHVTKDGKYKGDTHIAHDSDINVEVKKGGIATTIKNRFGPTGTTFSIFDYQIKSAMQGDRTDDRNSSCDEWGANRQRQISNGDERISREEFRDGRHMDRDICEGTEEEWDEECEDSTSGGDEGGMDDC